MNDEDKKFLEEKFGENKKIEDVYRDTTEEDWKRYREIKAKYDLDKLKEKKIIKQKRRNEEKYVHTCLRCNYTWQSEVESPKACAKCRSLYWNKPREKPKTFKQC